MTDPMKNAMRRKIDQMKNRDVISDLVAQHRREFVEFVEEAEQAVDRARTSAPLAEEWVPVLDLLREADALVTRARNLAIQQVRRDQRESR